MAKKFLIVAALVLGFVPSHAENMFRSMSLGAEIGGSLDLMLSDQETSAMGLGLGSHWGIYTVTNRKNNNLNFKLRLESISLHQEALSTSRTDYLSAGTVLKSLEQDWMLFGAGVEYREDKGSYLFFWEADLGYAIGQESDVFVRSEFVDTQVSKLELKTASNFYLSGGFGFKKKYQNRFSIFTSLRTFFLFGNLYSESDLKDKSLFLVPLLFSLGTEYQL